LFKNAVKEVVVHSQDVTNENEYNEEIMFEEENAIWYVGGFVTNASVLSRKTRQIV